jgi:Concanavalin A-like lectin/glucanases superfamily
MLSRVRTRTVVATLLVSVTGLFLAAAPAFAWEWPLRGYWPLHEGAGQAIHDISGNRNDGRLGRTSGRDGRDAEWIRGLFGIGTALRMDGDDYVAIPDTSSLRPDKVTVEAWVRAPRSPGQFKYVMVKGGDKCEAGSFGLYTSNNGGMAFYVYDGQRWWRSPMESPSMWDGGWHHVAGSYDGRKVRLFVDGRQVGDGTPFGGDIEYDLEHRNLFLGAYRGGCDLTFEGDIDELRVWTADLSIGSLWDQISGSLNREPAAPSLPDAARSWYDAG